MKKQYKSSVQRMNESRNHYKSLFVEQATGSTVFQTYVCPCADWDGTNCTASYQGISVQPYSNNGNTPAVGDYYTVNQASGPLAGITFYVLHVSNAGPNTGGMVISQQTQCDVGPTTGCDLDTFQGIMHPHLSQAPQQYVGNLHNNWLPMFFGKYDGHPDGCRFLNKRLSINEQKLQDLQAAGTNPQWQAMLTAKIAAIQAIIAECCS